MCLETGPVTIQMTTHSNAMTSPTCSPLSCSSCFGWSSPYLARSPGSPVYAVNSDNSKGRCLISIVVIQTRGREGVRNPGKFVDILCTLPLAIGIDL